MSASIMIDASKLTDAAIARKAGVHPATVGRWRAGKNEPVTPEQIDKLAKALGVSPAMIRPDYGKVFVQ